MSEEFPLSDLQSVPHTGSAGSLLRQAREAAGLHIAALAVSMKVPVKKLEALEADRLDLLPDAVFVRALASSMCRALKIDPRPVLQLLPQTAKPRLDTEERGINEPFQSASHASSTSVPDVLSNPVAWLVLVLVAGAVVLFALPPHLLGLDRDNHTEAAQPVALPATEVVAADAQNTPPVPAPAPLAAASESAPAAAVLVPVPTVAAPAATLAPVTKPAASAAVPAAPAVPVAAPATGAKPAASAPAVLTAYRPASAPVVAAKPDVSAPTVDLAGSANGVVVFKARGTSWVEVTDAKGVVQLRKTLFNGDTSGASGALPLSVVIGRADVTSVDVRGKPFSLATIARDNVARFEVK